MAIQGIIQGFANPDNLAENVMWLGKGSQYILYLNSNPVKVEEESLQFEQADRAWKQLSSEHAKPFWCGISEIHSNNVNAIVSVTRVSAFRYENRIDEANE